MNIFLGMKREQIQMQTWAIIMRLQKMQSKYLRYLSLCEFDLVIVRSEIPDFEIHFESKRIMLFCESCLFCPHSLLRVSRPNIQSKSISESNLKLNKNPKYRNFYCHLLLCQFRDIERESDQVYFLSIWNEHVRECERTHMRNIHEL